MTYANFNFSLNLHRQSARSCKTSSQSVEWLQKYYESSISNMAAVRHFEFLKYANFDLNDEVLCVLNKFDN